MEKHTKLVVLLIWVLLAACENTNKQSDNSPIRAEDTLWYNQPLRILQTVLRTPDAKGYDVQSTIDYLKKGNYNTLVINGGGIVDFFPNNMEMANPNKFLKGRDLLGEVTRACKKAGIRVIARVDFRGLEAERYLQHPDWFAKQSDGSPVIYNYTTPDFYAPCYNSYYRNEHANSFIRQLFEKYPIDGIWYNSVHCYDNCWCERCRSIYQEIHDEEMPLAIDNGNKEQFEYMREYSADRFLNRVRAVVKEYGEDKAFVAEVFGMYRVDQPYRTGVDIYKGCKYFDFLPNVCFITHNPNQIEYFNENYSASIVKLLKAISPEKEAVILFGGNYSSHRYIAEDPQYFRIWLFEALGSGGRFWNCVFNGNNPANTFDRRNAYLVSDIYKLVKENENIYDNQRPLFKTGIYYSAKSRNITGSDKIEHDEFGTVIQGWENALNLNHILYGFVPETRLTTKYLENLNTLILPNVAYLSDSEAKTIRAYVANGGNLIVSGETALYDSTGQSHKEFLLSDMMGVNYQDKMVSYHKNMYQHIAIRHEILKGFEKTDLLINLDTTFVTKASTQTKTITTHVPIFNSQPPEHAWPDTMVTDIPVITENKFGKGKVIYFANEPGRIFYKTGHRDMKLLIGNTVNYLEGNPLISGSNLPSSVHTHLTYNPENQTYIFSLVNTTRGTHKAIDEVIPLHDLNITLNLPEAVDLDLLKEVHGSANIESDGKSIDISLPELEEFYSVAFGATDFILKEED